MNHSQDGWLLKMIRRTDPVITEVKTNMNKRGLLIGIVFLSAMMYAQEPKPEGGDNTPTVTIDGLLYKLSEATNTAMVANDNTWDGELVIPEEVNYEGKTYTVDRIEWLAFNSCKTLTKVRIPKTIVDIKHYAQYEDCKNPFTGCTSLESIEVDEANPNMCSFDGVLFNKDKTWLFCYPAGLRSETYTVPDGVTRLGGNAFAYNPYLLSVQMPNSVANMAFGIFSNCKSLKSIQLSENIKYIAAYAFESCDNLRFLDIPESVTGFAEGVFRWSPLETILIRGTFPDGLRYDTFYNLDEEHTVIYCYPSEIDKFKTVFKGTVLPLGDWTGVYYRPLINDNKEWTMTYLGAVGPEYQHTFSYEQIKLGSAIEVDGMTFKQIVCSSWWNDQNGPSNWKETDEYLGEADGKVYLYNNQKSQNTVQIMDFTLQVGDTYRQMQMGNPNDYMDFVVTAVTDTVIATSIDKTPRKCLYLSRPGSTNIDDVWIEGIGSLVGGVRGGYEQLMGGAIPMLRTCQQDGQTLYEAYHPFLKEGKRWNCQEYYSNGWTGEQWTKDVSYVINGTTPIGGKTYYVMYRESEESLEFYCVREEGRKVWIKPPYDSERLLYDFGMPVGERYMPNEYEYNYQLTGIKTMRFQYDQLLKVFYYDISEHYDVTAPANHIATAPIVEGVGCEKGWNITELYKPQPTNGIINNEILLSCYEDGKCIFTADDFNDLTNPKPDDKMAYRPFVEEGKVWKVGSTAGISDGIVKMVDYYYFDGDTIINGKTCMQMMCQRYVSPNHPDYAAMSQIPSLRYVGAWYEEDKKVYIYNAINQFRMTYDFSLEANDTLFIHNQPYVIGPKQTGGLEGFKGVYRDIMWCFGGDPYYNYNTTWLEGVGGIDGPTVNVYSGEVGHGLFLMSCVVGDEVIYLNDEYEDGATPEGVRKKRFDFTHTIKTKPKARIKREKSDVYINSSERDVARPKVKARIRRGEAQSLYGEYNDQQLGINLDPLDDDYLVSITDESDKVVYEKAVNAGSIVALNIDISAYAKGLYTVTIENNNEVFTGEFGTETTGIQELKNSRIEKFKSIYNLQGQRLNSLQKGLNIVNGQKVYVK